MLTIPDKKVLFTGCEPFGDVKVSVKCESDSDGLILPTIVISRHLDEESGGKKELLFGFESFHVRALDPITLRFEDVYDSIREDDNLDSEPVLLLIEVAIVKAIKILRIDVKKKRKPAKYRDDPDVYDADVNLSLSGLKYRVITNQVSDDESGVQMEDAPYFFSKIRLEPLEAV